MLLRPLWWFLGPLIRGLLRLVIAPVAIAIATASVMDFTPWGTDNLSTVIETLEEIARSTREIPLILSEIRDIATEAAERIPD